ncbi:MAG: hypothetical protein A3A04_01645 [Candidatus Harrisonbacteria bacterium RIFCSPLOWO2_01_FULL_40_28]|uniref:Endolytic murein transglycosylase n=2 Tax=Candidatus Harrisoniibacteriota TaxID=1817905 RepID=A0A1G1ZW04_9BACT|nr:MAG: hypothetical protein A3A04_01645 [Candidatus Harrisonbacteria bacterium RIFCSPLOWO2_01_FULL_40_28]OGY68655.1 MAG: hypothetical protein A2586_01670 [Candidatus Harrisonbacteria bacterium RIFOXYD1_FULL_40_9]
MFWLFKKGFWLGVVFVLAFFVLIAGYFLYTLQPVDALSKRVEIVSIEEGTRFADIADLLSERGLIRSAKSFKLYSILRGEAQSLRSGIYVLRPASSSRELIDQLLGLISQTVTLTFREGITFKEIDTRLASYGILKEGALLEISPHEFSEEYPFLKNATSFEGFLFPDTYEFFAPSSPNVVLDKFLSNFERKAYPVLRDLTAKNLKKKITIASLLEREVPFLKDRLIVAGILEKRLNIGMPLQVDATVLYTKCGGLITECANRSLSKKDFSFDSPYNTYLYNGLTPTPIGNPGLDAIMSALRATYSPYFYYLSDPRTQKTIFSETIDEHNENRFKYLNI